MKTIITRIKRLALALCFVTPLVSWAANAPTATVDGTSVTISNESGAESWDNAELSPLSSYQNKTFTVPEIGTDVPAGTILKVSSVSFAKSTSMTKYPAKIKIAGCVSAAATVTSGGFTTAGADKITYSFGDGICLLKAGTASQIAFLDANGVQLTSGGSFGFRLGYNAYQFVGNVVWSSKVPIVEIAAEVVDGYVNFEASSGNGWGFQSGSGSGKVYVSGYKNYMLTPGTNEKEIVLTDGTYGYAFDIKDANSMSSQNKNQITDWAKISGDGTLTTASANSSRLPFLLLRDTSDFTGTINATASCKLTTVFCGTSETFDDGVLYNKLFANYTGSMYVTSERSTLNSNVVTIPAGKTWTGTALLNEGETVIDGTFAGPVVNSGVLTVNGAFTGTISNSGSGTVTVNAGATIPSFGSVRDFTGFTVDSSVTAAVTMTSEEYGKGSISIAGATGISSITVLAPDGTTTLGTITPDTTGAGELALASVNVSGLACWYDWEMNGNLDGSGVNTAALTYDSGSAANNFYNSAMLYTYRHPYTSVTFPATWTAVVRCTVPKVVNGTVITFGTKSTSFIGLIAGDNPETEMKLVRYNSGDQAYSVLASMPIVDGTSAQHVYVFSVENNSAVKVYCDGSLVLDDTFATFSLGGGIQIGSAHGGVAGGLVRMWAGDTYDGFTTSDLEEARVDCVRLYDYSLSAEQVAALAAEFPAVKLYRATVAADANTTWGELSWSPAWDDGNSQSKVILTAEGDATVTLPATITAEEVQLVIPAESTVALTGPGTLAVTEPVDVSGGTLSLSGTLTLDEDLVISGSVVFDGVTTDGTGGLKLANGATVGVDAALVVTPLGTYTLAEGTVVDAAYSSGEGDVKLIPLTSAVVSITQGETTLYYSDLDTAVGLLVNPSTISDDVVVTLLNGTTWPTTTVDYAGMLQLYGYYIDDNGILTKAVARILTTMYPTLAAAVGAAADGATVGLLRASSEAITLNDKAITLSETANFSGTLTGNGTLTFAAFRNNPSITFDNWTGTVVLPSFAADGTKLNKYGVAGSTVVLKGITSGWFGETSTQKMDVAPVLQLDGNVTIKGFSTSWDYTFAELAGTGNFVLDPTDNSPKSVTITKVAEDFSGIITNNTTVTLTIGTLERADGTSTAVDEKLLDVSGDVVAEALTVDGEPVDVRLETREDGIYVGAPYVAEVVDGGSYTTLQEAVDAATSGQTVTLLADVDVSDEGVTFPADTTLTLDLNNCTITAANTETGHVQVNGALTITDSSEEAGGKIVSGTSGTYGVVQVAEKDVTGASLTIAGGAIEAYFEDETDSNGQHPAYGVVVKGTGTTFTMTGGSIKAGYMALMGHGKKASGGTYTISGGTLTSMSDFVAYFPTKDDCAVTISGGTFSGLGGVSARAGTVTITGGTFTASGNGTAPGSSPGTTGLGFMALAVTPNYGNVTVSVSGGTFTSATDVAAVMATTSTYTGTISLTGGTYSTDVSDYCATGYEATEDNGVWVVAALPNYTVTFDADGGTPAPAAQTVQKGSTATAPTEPTKADYTFAGWTLGGSAYDFATPVTGNITLVASWTAVSSGIDPTDPTSTQEVTPTAEEIAAAGSAEAAAIAKATVTVPDGVSGVDAETYKTYFTYSATPTETAGTYTVAITGLADEVTETADGNALAALEAATAGGKLSAEVAVKPGLYYGTVAGADVTTLRAPAGTLNTTGKLDLSGVTKPSTGEAFFIKIKVGATAFAAEEE